jgi:hypothetical protein
MRHIALTSFDRPPCNGEILYTPPSDEKNTAIAAHRSLPIFGQRPQSEAEPAPGVWICAGCGQTWTREPLPQEAL